MMELTKLPAPRRDTAGFTLIELMITVAIVAILATIAYPSYRNYVLRGQIINATNGLTALQANMERYYQDNRTYAPAAGGFNPPCATASVIGTFTVSCPTVPVAPGLTYTITAVGSGVTAAFTYSVDQNNNQNTVIAGLAGWNTAGAGCWVTKQGPTC